MIKNNYKPTDVFLIIFFFVASGLFSIYLGQDGNWDLRNYHFYNAYAFLNNRLTFDIVPAQLQTFHNPLLDVPFYLMITQLPPVVYGFIIGGLHGLNIWLIYKIAYHILVNVSQTKRQLLSLLAGITGYCGAANLSETGSTYHDNLTSLFVLGGVLLIVSSILECKTRPMFISKKRVAASGFLFGFATGLKFVVAVYSLAFVFALLLTGNSWKENIKNATLSAFSIGIGFIVSNGYWMTVLWTNFHNPLFPYYNKIFKSPYYEVVNLLDTRYFPEGTFEILFYPFHFLKNSSLVSPTGFFDARMALCYILLTLFVFMVFYRRVTRKYGYQEIPDSFQSSDNYKKIFVFITAFLVFSYIIWQYMFSIYRYMIPLELLAPVFIILIMRYIFPFERVFIRLAVGIFIFMIVTVSPMNHGRVSWAKSYFGVRVPPLENIADSTIIMAGDNPLSYIIPFFPKSTRFISVSNNFTNPSSKTLLQKKIKKILHDEGLNIYLLYKEKNPKVDYNSILKSYNLETVKNDSERLYTRFDDDLFLVPVTMLD